MKKLIYLFIIFAFVACNSVNKSQEKSANKIAEVEATINIGGMHCNNCITSVEKGINGLDGIESVTVSLSDSNAVVKFDPGKVDLAEIEKAIEKRGYKVKGKL